jgi:hypothetical protein
MEVEPHRSSLGSDAGDDGAGWEHFLRICDLCDYVKRACELAAIIRLFLRVNLRLRL